MSTASRWSASNWSWRPVEPGDPGWMTSNSVGSKTWPNTLAAFRVIWRSRSSRSRGAATAASRLSGSTAAARSWSSRRARPRSSTVTSPRPTRALISSRQNRGLPPTRAVTRSSRAGSASDAPSRSRTRSSRSAASRPSTGSEMVRGRSSSRSTLGCSEPRDREVATRPVPSTSRREASRSSQVREAESNQCSSSATRIWRAGHSASAASVTSSRASMVLSRRASPSTGGSSSGGTRASPTRSASRAARSGVWVATQRTWGSARRAR